MGQSVLPPPPQITYQREIFLASGTFTLPKTSFNKFDAILVSGGGGGARKNNGNSNAAGGGGCVAHFQDIFCNNETTLTITVGGGGAGLVTGTSDGNNGTPSTITGITGNGAATTLSSGTGSGGKRDTTAKNAQLSPSVGFKVQSDRGNRASAKGMGFGIGMSSFSSGLSGSSANNNTTIFGSSAHLELYTCNNVTPQLFFGGDGGPSPLLGSLLHAPVGASGTAGVSAGGSSIANTFFAGNGGGSTTGTSAGSAGQGGGGGGGGGSNNSGIAGGNGGDASINSGAGGGGAGIGSISPFTPGNSGSGGSGFVIIGYWG